VDRLEQSEGLFGRRLGLPLAVLLAAVLLAGAGGAGRRSLALGAGLLGGVALLAQGLRARKDGVRARAARAEEAATFERGLAELSVAAPEHEGLPATLAAVCERAPRLLGCDVVVVSLLNGRALVPRAVRPVSDDIVVEPVSLDADDSPAAAAARERRAVLVEAPAKGDRPFGTDLVARGVRRVLAVPLLGRGRRSLGALTCGDDGAPRDLEALRVRAALVAAQAAAAAERVVLGERVREEAARVQALLRVSREIGRDGPYGERVVAACRLTRELLAADRAAIFPWDADRHCYSVAVDDRMSPAEAEERAAVELRDPGELGLSAMEQGRVIVAPLVHGDRYHGLLVARRVVPAGGFDEGAVALLETIAHQCAMVLDGIRRMQGERTAASLALTLLSVAQEFSSTVESGTLLARLVARATELTCATAALVAIREPAGTLYRIEVVHGVPAERAELLQGVLVEEDDLARRLAVAAGADTARSGYLGVPIERAGACVGMLLLVWREGKTPTHRESALALGLASQAAVALETVRLLDEGRVASHLKSQFVAIMSHELRTPLSVVMGYTDLLLEEAFGPLNEEQAGVLTRMQRSARELLDLITATLDLNRLESGRSQVTVETVAVAELFAQLEADTAARLDARSIELCWRLEPDLPPMETDPTKLRTVLKNLIGNAIKFTDRGSVTVSAAREDGAVVFTVADTGVGIRREDLPVVFEMFRQVESANTRRHGGVGLGLYIVKRLLAELRGEIDVESEAGVGSRFRVRVPIRLSASAPAGARPA
jgi:signal transduction histidine kinase